MVRMVPARRASSSTNLDLPVPCSPTISTTRPAPPVTAARSSSERRQHVGHTGQRQRIHAVVARPVGGADGSTPCTGRRLPLTMNGGSGVVANRTGRAVEDVGGGQHLARFGLGHQAGGQVHRVAHHGEGPPEGRAHVAGEHRAGS